MFAYYTLTKMNEGDLRKQTAVDLMAGQVDDMLDQVGEVAFRYNTKTKQWQVWAGGYWLPCIPPASVGLGLVWQE